jgi:hypothetical protein
MINMANSSIRLEENADIPYIEKLLKQTFEPI